jgi:hydroxymethylglutaryl-CoA lyase
MADNAAVMAAISRRARRALHSVLTPNLKGLEAALLTRPDEIVVFGAASEAFSQKNINCSMAESIERFAPVVEFAHAAGVKVRGALSCALGLPVRRRDQRRPGGARGAPDEGHRRGRISALPTPSAWARRSKVQAAMERALKHLPAGGGERPFPRHLRPGAGQCLRLPGTGHPHLRRQRGGLGGCPYAKGATGNVATEDVVFMLNGLGIETGIDIDKLVDAGAFISNALGRPPVSRVAPGAAGQAA